MAKPNEEERRILAIDPGGTTGYVLAEIYPDYSLPCVKVLDSGTIKAAPKDWREALIEFSQFNPHVMFIESVVTTGVLDIHKVTQIASADKAAFWAFLNNITTFWVRPDERKTIDDLMEVPKCLRSPHTRDAFRLIVAGLLREGDSWTVVEK